MTLSRHFYAVTAILTILSAISLSSTRLHRAAAPTQTSNVLVVNGVAQPIPTQAQGTTNVAGSVAVSNFPATQSVAVTGTTTVGGSVAVSNFPVTQSVSVTGIPSVAVTSLPAVQMADGSAITVNNAVANPLPVHDVDVAARQTVTSFLSQPVADGDDGVVVLYNVPVNKILVITDCSLFGLLPFGDNLNQCRLTCALGPNPFAQYMPVKDQGAQSALNEGWNASLDGGQLVCGPGSEIIMQTQRYPKTGGCLLTANMNGYLENAP